MMRTELAEPLSSAASRQTPRGPHLRAAFDAPAPPTVGLEEEPCCSTRSRSTSAPPARRSWAARATPPALPSSSSRRRRWSSSCRRSARSLPRSAALARGAPDGSRRRRATSRSLAVAGTHPFAAPLGVLNRGPALRRDRCAEYGDAARAQLVCSLQVHVAVGGAERALAVYNALRGHLPELAALAANAPLPRGPRHGLRVRPAADRDAAPAPGRAAGAASPGSAFAAALRWARHPGAQWWWELRPHPAFGTLELRVPDAQTTVEDAAAVAAFAHALVVWLAERHDEGERLGAARDVADRGEPLGALRARGVEGELRDLDSGERRPTREPPARPSGRAGTRRRAARRRTRAAGGARAGRPATGHWRCAGRRRGPRPRNRLAGGTLRGMTHAEQAVLDAVERRRDDLAALAAQLIAYDTTAGPAARRRSRRRSWPTG